MDENLGAGLFILFQLVLGVWSLIAIVFTFLLGWWFLLAFALWTFGVLGLIFFMAFVAWNSVPVKWLGGLPFGFVALFLVLLLFIADLVLVYGFDYCLPSTNVKWLLGSALGTWFLWGLSKSSILFYMLCLADGDKLKYYYWYRRQSYGIFPILFTLRILSLKGMYKALGRTYQYFFSGADLFSLVRPKQIFPILSSEFNKYEKRYGKGSFKRSEIVMQSIRESIPQSIKTFRQVSLMKVWIITAKKDPYIRDCLFYFFENLGDRLANYNQKPSRDPLIRKALEAPEILELSKWFSESVKFPDEKLEETVCYACSMLYLSYGIARQMS